MKTTFLTLSLVVLLPLSLYGQDINNTLGSTGTFTIKDGSTTFFSLSQSDGRITLPVTTGSTLGVIFKGPSRFIHDYQASGTTGLNTFVGANSGNFAMSGTGTQASNNTAVGYSSLTSLTTGQKNSAFGSVSLALNTTGSWNCALGDRSLFFNTTGDNNSAFGYYSLYSNTTGDNNSAFGSWSLSSDTTGSSNSAFGYWSLVSSTGSQNSAFGHFAGLNLTTGSNNTLIGYNAQTSLATISNEVVLGDANIATLRCNVQTITSLSDTRDKKNIKDLPLGLDFLMNVKPRQFNWDRREWYEDGRANGSKMKENPTAGFIAQELDEVQTKEGAEWLNLVLKSNPDRLEATPGNLLPIMVKAIQELKSENDALRNEVVTLRASIAEQVRKEVKAVLLKAVQPEDATTKVSLNEAKD